MLTAVALPRSALPLRLADHPRLAALAHDRGGEPEFQFHLSAAVPLLPIRHEGQLRIARWGCRRGESRVLPVGGWTRRATVESGYWSRCGAEAVEVPAALGLDGGVWFAIRQGVRGVLVRDEGGAERAYLVCEPSSYYYAVMTRSAWMPVLIGERILRRPPRPRFGLARRVGRGMIAPFARTHPKPGGAPCRRARPVPS